ncbi:helix-turn-helix domain-containing protein [Shimia litoralis]|uniref:Helix-turn-helix domain-containing protein n=1 Tax=Shimia litoralis TaxID=420403 RepID=A0A4U7N197_9RHOB|nr:helix-turn-helix domain-containing protein [Shimia litoralis]TKZ19409.1 helix-turn-helix domain-containing protein [Shimia litoralis]
MLVTPVKNATAQNTTTVGFLCADGMPLDQLALGLEYLKLAGQLSGDEEYSVVLLSIHGGDITTSCGMGVSTNPIGRDGADFHVLVLLGGLQSTSEHKRLRARTVRGHLRVGAIVIAVDRAVFALAETKVLNGLTASVSADLALAFQEQFPDVQSTREDSFKAGRIWTASAGFSFLSLLSGMVARQLSQSKLNELNRNFLTYRPTLSCGCTLKPDGLESGDTGNEAVDKAIHYFRTHMEEPLPLSDVAKKIGVSLRQLERHFRSATGLSPKAYYIYERMEQAKMMVHATNISLQEIALATGFGSYATLSYRYKKTFQVTPVQERRQRAQRENFYYVGQNNRCAGNPQEFVL